MENYKAIQDVIKKHPDVLNNRQKLRSVLLDFFPTDKLTVNMFLMAYDEGLLSKIESANVVDEFMFRNFINVLSTDYGVTDETARGVIKLAADVLNKMVQEPEIPEITVAPVVPASEYKQRQAPTKPMSPETPTSVKDFRYASNGSEVRINKYTGKGGKVVIPDYIEGLPVTRIAENAFYAYGSKGAEKITEIRLPSRLQYIGSGAFQSIEKLTGVLILPPTLKKVDSHAFQSTGLTGLVIQSDCELDVNAFSNLYDLEFIYIAKGCSPAIGWAVFGYSEKMKDVVLPADISSIKEETFEGCNEMTIYAPKGSYAANYGMKNFINVNTDQYEKKADYYKRKYDTI